MARPAPAPARVHAISLPIPFAAPVTTATLPWRRIGVFPSKFTLEHLAIGVARQALTVNHTTDPLLPAHPGVGPFEKCVDILDSPRMQHNDRHRGLAPARAGHADDGHLRDGRVLTHNGLDVGWINILSAGDDHVLFAVDNVEKTLRVNPAKVAGAQPLGAGRVHPGCLSIGIVPSMITGHHEPAAADDFPGLA